MNQPSAPIATQDRANPPDGGAGSPALVDARDGAIQARWLAALRHSLPNLAKPIAIAMVEGTAKGSIGQALGLIENGLMQIENADVGRLTGSEVKVLTAILRQMNQTVIHLDGEITRLYVAQDD